MRRTWSGWRKGLDRGQRPSIIKALDQVAEIMGLELVALRIEDLDAAVRRPTCPTSNDGQGAADALAGGRAAAGHADGDGAHREA